MSVYILPCASDQVHYVFPLSCPREPVSDNVDDAVGRSRWRMISSPLSLSPLSLLYSLSPYTLYSLPISASILYILSPTLTLSPFPLFCTLSLSPLFYLPPFLPYPLYFPSFALYSSLSLSLSSILRRKHFTCQPFFLRACRRCPLCFSPSLLFLSPHSLSLLSSLSPLSSRGALIGPTLISSSVPTTATHFVRM